MPYSRRDYLKQLAGCIVAGSVPPLWAGAAAASAAEAKPARRSPGRLMCNLLPNPIGIEGREPRLSWEVPELGRSTMQSAFQVQIVRAGNAFTKRAMRWDSEQQASPHSTAVRVPPGVLEPDKAYSWRVRVWDERGTRSRWSAP